MYKFYIIADAPSQSIRIVAVKGDKLVKAAAYKIDILNPLPVAQYKDFIRYFDKTRGAQIPEPTLIDRDKAARLNLEFCSIGLIKTIDYTVLPEVFKGSRTRAFGYTITRKPLTSWFEYRELIKAKRKRERELFDNNNRVYR